MPAGPVARYCPKQRSYPTPSGRPVLRHLGLAPRGRSHRQQCSSSHPPQPGDIWLHCCSAAPEALALLSMWAPSLVIVDVRFPEQGSKQNTLRHDESILYMQPADSRANHHGDLRDMKRFLRSIGLIPLRTVRTPLGASAHYAGGIPFEKDSSTSLLSTKPTGELLQHAGIYVADSATWRALPAEPPALTIMANARRIGIHIARTAHDTQTSR